MAEKDNSTPVASRSDRLQFALRQAGLVTLALLVAGVVAERLRPDDVADRGFVTAIFWGAIAIWVLVLLLNAGFERSQMRALEGPPLYAAGAIGLVAAVIGVIQVGGSAILYVFAAALGTAMFWWGLLGLGLLLVRRVSS